MQEILASENLRKPSLAIWGIVVSYIYPASNWWIRTSSCQFSDSTTTCCTARMLQPVCVATVARSERSPPFHALFPARSFFGPHMFQQIERLEKRIGLKPTYVAWWCRHKEQVFLQRIFLIYCAVHGMPRKHALIILDHSTITRLTMQVIPGIRTAPALSKELDTKIVIVLFFVPSCTLTGKPTWSTRKGEKTSLAWIITLVERFSIHCRKTGDTHKKTQTIRWTNQNSE